MKRSVTSFVCQECGYDSPAYLGKCPECGSWNSFREFQEARSKKQEARGNERKNIKPLTLSEVHYREEERIKTGFWEMDTVLGGGIVAGSVILLAGDPGVGKSTLLLQIGLNLSFGNKVVLNPAKGGVKDPLLKHSRSEKQILRLAQNDNFEVLYISGEESLEQIKLRASRIYPSNKSTQNKKESNTTEEHFKLLSLNDADEIVRIIEEQKPNLVIIDSIQTVESPNAGGLSGSVSQIRYAASAFIRLAKTLQIPVILVGHVTKEGMVAGPMTLSHMVDVVLFFEGEKATNTRILRSFKNRFGPVDEVGVFLMEEEGIKEVKEPQQIFLTMKRIESPGSVLSVTLEGTRAFLIEMQGLTVSSQLPMPRRVASGVDNRRLELLLAVLQKHARLPLGTIDVFVNTAGGIRIDDRGVDLAVCLSLFSSLHGKNISRTVAIAEVGLLGELRVVPGLEKRVNEAKKLGFTDIITAKTHTFLAEVVQSIRK